ncbi:MAG TPA: hypothetical protein VJZ00_19605 [Thermoanaerobaculia bacterium]|nr:hypothetical protein [Thermoanaerobaculia bacterium]
MTLSAEQASICAKYGATPFAVSSGLKAGVAANVWSGLVPLNGLRHPQAGDSSGWYLWAGEEFSTDPDLWRAVHIEHLSDIRPEVMKYLALPPGWRFLIARDYEDVWYDESLLNV